MLSRAIYCKFYPIPIQLLKISTRIPAITETKFCDKLKVNQSFYSVTWFRCYSSHNKSEETFEAMVDYEHVKKALCKPEVLIVDVRQPDEIKEHGKIPNSINIPLGNVTSTFSQMSDKDFYEAYERRKPDKDTEIIFYCMIGKRSGKAQQDALKLGFKNVKNYLGSWTDWAAKHTNGYK